MSILDQRALQASLETYTTVGVRDLHQRLSGLFRQAYARGARRRAWAALLGRPTHLQDLDEAARRERVGARHAAGLHTISLDRIVGSEGRSGDFDAAFYPLNHRLEPRWVDLAVAQLSGAVLPPVELIQLGERYFVRDGHHRLSLARALGQAAIESNVTVWEIEPGDPESLPVS